MRESLRALLRLGPWERRRALELDAQDLYALRLRVGFAGEVGVKEVLVTGATGFLGFHVVRRLNERGCAAPRRQAVGPRPNERTWPCRPDSCDRGAPSFDHGPARSGAAPANTLSGWLARPRLWAAVSVRLW